MSANTQPVFGKYPNVGIKAAMTAANNTLDLTSGTSYLIWTAGSAKVAAGDAASVGATHGSYIKDIQLKANPANNTAGTVFRIWLNNGGSLSDPTTTFLWKEIGLSSLTASATAAQPDFAISIERGTPPGFRVYATLGTAPGGSGEFGAAVFGSDY